MLRTVLQRLFLAVPVLLGVLLVGFLLMQVVPNDPAVVRAGPTATQEVIEAIRRDLGLGQPLWIQFLIYLGRLLRGDLGNSIINNMPVIDELGNTIGPTLELMLASLIWSVPLGILLGTVGAYWRGRWPDRLIVAASAPASRCRSSCSASASSGFSASTGSSCPSPAASDRSGPAKESRG